MNCSQVASLIEEIKISNDKNFIYKKLVKIRTDIIKNDAGIDMFYSADGIRLLVNLMNKPYEKILEVVLSILGNCCMKKESCKQAFELGVLPPLISIIASVPNPSIQCRGCRLLGNLAQHPQISYTINKDNGNTAYALNSILSESDNTAVLIMTIRAIRQLWNEKNFRNVIINQGCIRKIIQILLKYSRNATKETASTENEEEEMEEEDENEKVVIKRLHAPDRTVTREKFNNIVKHMENSHHCDIVGYQLLKTYRWKDNNDYKMPENGNKEICELFTGILKCLQMITTTINEKVAEEIYGENGCGYKCLVFLCSENSQFRALSLKVVSNLASNPDAIDKLTSCDVITMASDLIMYANLDDAEVRYCVSVMCLMTKEACNRGHIRRSGALKAFMNIAKQTKGQKELGMILYALYQYRFDNLSFEILLSNGLVGFLIKILKEIIENKSVEHIKNDDKDTMKTSVYSKKKSSHQKSAMKRSELLLRYKNFDFRGDNYYQLPKKSKLEPYFAPESPESGSSGYASASTSYRNRSASPTNSGYYSPSNTPPRNSNEDFDDSQDYSPVCSDNEEADENESAVQDNLMNNELNADNSDDEDDKSTDFDILAYLYDDNSSSMQERPTIDEEIQQGMKSKNNCSFDDTIDDNEMHDIELEIISTKTFEKYPMQPILTLLWSISRTKPFSEFVQSETLDTLLKICRMTQKPRGRAFQILGNILMHINHFVPLLKQDFVFRLHEFKTPFSSHIDCWSCDEMKKVCNELMTLFGSVGETGYGHGEIAHILVTGEEILKNRVAIIITYIIKEPKLLYKLLFDYDTLNTVMKIILNEDDEKYEQYMCNAACSGLTTLALHLNITRVEDEVTCTEDDAIFCSESSSSVLSSSKSCDLNDTKVTFKVKYRSRNESVEVSRDLLINGSDVFNRMFSGDHFIESINNEVTLTEDVSIEGLKYFFYLIELQTKNELTDIAPPAKVITASLDALNLSKKYLLPQIEKSVLNIIKTLLNDDCVLTVFEWSLRYYNQQLLLASTHYFLYSDINSYQKCKLFRLANKSIHREEWRKLLVETILFKLQPNLE